MRKMPVNYDPYGFNSFDMMFEIVPVIVAVGFVVGLGMVVFNAVQGASQ